MNGNEGQRLDRVRITVSAAASHPDVLSVQDAMRQVLDFFDLLTPEGDDSFVWNLKLATTNSPLTVEGEAYSATSLIHAGVTAAQQASIVDENLRSLSEGRVPRSNLSAKRREALKRIYKRNMNGIGVTEVTLHAPMSFYVTPSIAERSVMALEANEFDALVLIDRSRDEIGSVEGTLIEVGTDYNQPSVIIRDRRTNAEINCRVTEDLRQTISANTTLDDVWANRRVVVRGRIRYNADGSVMRVMKTESIQPVNPRAVANYDIVDPDFTSGVSIYEYLNRLREGEIG